MTTYTFDLSRRSNNVTGNASAECLKGFFSDVPDVVIGVESGAQQHMYPKRDGCGWVTCPL